MKTEKEYQECKSRLAADLKEFEVHAEKMTASGLTEEQIKLALDPMTSFAYQLQEEIEEKISFGLNRGPHRGPYAWEIEPNQQETEERKRCQAERALVYGEPSSSDQVAAVIG